MEYPICPLCPLSGEIINIADKIFIETSSKASKPSAYSRRQGGNASKRHYRLGTSAIINSTKTLYEIKSGLPMMVAQGRKLNGGEKPIAIRLHSLSPLFRDTVFAFDNDASAAILLT